MKNFLLIVVILLLVSCSKTKTVLICGDHVCINKKEAEQYFEDNLSLELNLIDKKEKNKFDLDFLNLKYNVNIVKKVSITEKKETNKSIKTLSNDEIIEKKAELKRREKISKLENLKKKKEKVLKNKKDKNKEIKSIEVRKTKT